MEIDPILDPQASQVDLNDVLEEEHDDKIIIDHMPFLFEQANQVEGGGVLLLKPSLSIKMISYNRIIYLWMSQQSSMPSSLMIP
jgi:hypothetical protein